MTPDDETPTIMRPVKATIRLTLVDGTVHLCASASHVAALINETYGLQISLAQAMRLCHYHSYKRAKFTLPEGLIIQRLNSTKRTRRNLERQIAEQVTESEELLFSL